MSQQWYFRRNGQESGPLTSQQLKQLATSRQLRETDLVRTATNPEWRPAGTIKGLFDPEPSDTPDSEVSSKPATTRISVKKFLKTRIGIGLTITTILFFGYIFLKPRSPQAGSGVARELRGIPKPVSNIDTELERIRKQIQRTVDLQVANSVEEANRRKIADAEQKLKEEQARLQVQQDLAARRAKQQEEIARRKAESALQDEKEQANRRQYAEHLFGAVSLDPSKCFILSKSLKAAGTTVELRGKDYTTLRRLYDRKDWLGVIGVLQQRHGVSSSIAEVRRPDKFPPASIIDEAFYRLCSYDIGLYVLVKTNLRLERGPARTTRIPLESAQFPLSLDGKFCYSENITGLYFGAYHSFERHPDGIGYLRKWNVGEGICILWISSSNGEDEAFLSAVHSGFDEQVLAMKKKLQIGELDDASYKLRVAAEMFKAVEQTRHWAENH